jgi:serine protease Do
MPSHRIQSCLAALGFACSAAALAAAPAMKGAVLTELRTAFNEGDRIGTVHAGANCASAADRGWSQLIRQRVEAEVSQVFRDELARLQPASSGARAAPLKVQAFLNNIDVDLCQAAAGAWQGGFYVQLGWQIVAPASGKVVYQASTEGSYSLASPQRMSTANGLRQAIGVAVRNLMSDRRFAAALEQNEPQRHMALANAF